MESLKHTVLSLGLLSSLLLLPSPASASDNHAADALTRCTQLATTDFSGVPDAPIHVSSARVVADADGLPEHCLVTGYIAPQVGFELRLPTTSWEGRFLMQGCGGFCGYIYTPLCNDALQRNYAVIMSDMGHKGTALDGKWAYNNRQAEIDFGYRATHVTAVAGKAIVEAYYGEPPRYSYFRGCSTGGRQGLVAVQQFPEDFDGVIAGAPPMNEVREAVFGLGWPIIVNKGTDGQPILTVDKLPVLHKAAIAACDMNDGIKDNVIGDPMICQFDPAVVQCKTGDSGDCLTPAQVEVAREIYRGAHDSKGNPLVPGGAPPGSEMRWAGYLGVESSAGGNLRQMYADFLRYMAFSEDPGPSYDPATFDYDLDTPRLQFMERLYNAENPDIRPFQARGGKLLLYMGLEDSFVPVRLTNYYETVERIIGDDREMREFFRMYLIPGMGHCAGGDGVDTFDWLSAMEAWVERGEAPDRLVGHKLRSEGVRYNVPFPVNPDEIDFSRPVFPYPDRAIYDGRGPQDSADSFRRKRN